MVRHTRRRFLRTGGATLLGAAGLSTAAVGETVSGWTKADSPATKTLHGVTIAQNGPWAVGGDGAILHRRQSGDWVMVREEGLGNGTNLRTIDVTDGGRRIWFAGASGVIGEYDVVTDTMYEHVSPQDITDTWEGIAVQGRAGRNEHIYLVNGSGAQLTGVRQGDGDVHWRNLKKPGSGSSLKSIDFYDKRKGHTCDTNQSVFHTNCAGRNWKKIGIGNTDENFYEVASVDEDDVNVVGGSGQLFWYDGTTWHEFDVADHTLRGLDRDAAFGLATDTAGFAYEREGVGTWVQQDTPTDKALYGVTRGTTYPDVAAGESGVIVERPT